MDRRKFIQQSGLASAGLVIGAKGFAFSGAADFPDVRVPIAARKFSSKAVEQLILDLRKKTANKEIGWLFENCFPNTLDTSVDYTEVDGKPDTYVITGDIDAMWPCVKRPGSTWC